MKVTPEARTHGGYFWPLLASVLLSTGFVAPDSGKGKSHGKGSFDLVLKEHVLRVSSEMPRQIPKALSGADAGMIRADAVSGEIRTVAGRLLSEKISADEEPEAWLAQVEKYVDGSDGRWLGVSFSDLELNRDALLFNKEEQFFKFRVKRNGLLVQDASVDFRFKHGFLIQVINQSFSEAVELRGAGMKNLEASLPRPPGPSAVAESDLRYRVRLSASGKAYELVPVRAFLVSSPDGKSWHAQLNTLNGELIDYQSLERHYALKVSGEVHPRWYTESLEARAFGNLKVGDVYTGADGTVDFPGEDAPELNGLQGKYVKVSPQTGGGIFQTAQLEDGQWKIDLRKPGTDEASHDKYIAQLMIYYHTNFIYGYAKQFIEHPWLNQPITANANLSRTCNAHYSGNTINLYSAGGGCANTGLISDVILHEWGHALDDQTGGIDDGAFSEGFGDIMSLVITHSNLLGIGFRIPSHDPVRDLDPDKIYPQDARGGVHSEGLIIGSTFWDLWNELKDRHGAEEGGRLLSNYAFKMILAARRYTEVYDALLAIDDNNGDLSDGSPNMCSLNKIFAQHGLAEESVACKLAAVESWNLQGDEDQDGIPEPGETLDLTVTVRNSSAVTLENLTGTLSIEGNAGVEVSREPLTWGPVASGGTATSATAARISLSPEVSCGSNFTAKLKLKADTREVVQSRTFNIGKLSGQAENLQAEGLPLPIRDHQTTTAGLEVASGQWAEDTGVLSARLKFDITHTYRGDLTVHLIAPDGSSKEVYKGSGSADDVHFDEDISAKIAGLKGKGTWTLSVNDKASRDEGSLDTFSLSLTPASFVCD